MKKIIISSVFLCALVLFCFAADLTGSWKGLVKMQDGSELDVTYKFKAEGEVLTGVVISSYGEIPVTDGKIKGNDFKLSLQIGDNMVEQTGKFYQDSIVINSEFQGTPRKMTFKRVVDK